MQTQRITSILRVGLALAAAAVPAPAQGQQPLDLTGLWEAKRRLGPDVRGTLTIDRANGAWRASIVGQTAPVLSRRDSMSFRLPGGERFAGRLNSQRNAIVGHWFRPRVASPVTLRPCG